METAARALLIAAISAIWVHVAHNATPQGSFAAVMLIVATEFVWTKPVVWAGNLL